MISIREAIIVEGRYDRIKLSSITDALVLDVGGFGIFGDDKKLGLIKELAQKQGIIILTDSDRAGFIIRNYLTEKIKNGTVKQAYIPDVPGKESRKERPSKEGKLGVEGIEDPILEKALVSAGTRKDATAAGTDPVTKADLYELGLSGRENSFEKRTKVMKSLGLPERMSASAMLDVINCLMGRDEFVKHVKGIE